LVRRLLFGLLYQPPMIDIDDDDDDECGAVGGMRIGRGIRSTRGKPAPLPLCPPQIPHGLGSSPGSCSGKPVSNGPSKDFRIAGVVASVPKRASHKDKYRVYQPARLGYRDG
jgi:hypothetical protein